MDADRLAALLRALTAAPSRRTALRALAGLGLAGLLGHAEARKRKKKKKKTCRTLRCTECAPCAGKTCQPKPEGTSCSLSGGGGQCFQGQCLRVIPCNPATTPSTCPAGQVLDPNTCLCVALA